MLCTRNLVKIGPVALEKIVFFVSSMYFCYFIIISPLKWAWPFIWANLNLLHQRILCAKFGWNWHSCFWEEDFLIFVNVFSLFFNYLGWAKNIDYAEFMRVWFTRILTGAVWGLEDTEYEIQTQIFTWPRLFWNHRHENHTWFEHTLIPFAQGCFVPSLVEIGPVVLDKTRNAL